MMQVNCHLMDLLLYCFKLTLNNLILIQEQNIPIDIQTSKLLDWIINRRHCQKSWPQQITLVREKINSAIQDMPEHVGITKLLTGTCMLSTFLIFYQLIARNLPVYKHLQILTTTTASKLLKSSKKLKQTPGAFSADMVLSEWRIGRYYIHNNVQSFNWFRISFQEVVRLYEKDNVYLAEASQILMRNVAYEIPGTKKAISKCEQVQHVSFHHTYSMI